MGTAMSRVVVFTAVPAAKRAIAATMAGLSGNVTEHSVELTAVEGGPSALWSASQGRPGEKWWGASQAFDPQIANEMLTSGYILGTESWFAAFWEDTGEPAPYPSHNFALPPPGSTFAAFLTAAGLQRIEQVL